MIISIKLDLRKWNAGANLINHFEDVKKQHDVFHPCPLVV
jgi:hypothetical protein